MKKRRLLFVDHVDRILGGAELNLIELAEWTTASGTWEVGCACQPESQLGAALATLRVERFRHGLGASASRLRLVHRRLAPWAALRGWLEVRRARVQLAQAIAAFEPAAVISCNNKDHFCAGPAAVARGVPAIWWVNDILSGDFFPWLVRRVFCRQAKQHARRLVAVSECARQALVQLGLPAARVATVHNGIPLARYVRRPAGPLRATLGAPASQPLIGMVGRFTPWKGQDFFLRLAREWAREGKPGHFALIGQAFNEDQAFEGRLRQFVEAEGLGERVHFSPFSRDVAGILSELDVLVHGSTRPEPFGRVLIEAMAVEVPVIAAGAGGTVEIITHGKDGLLARPGDLAEYRTAVGKLIDEPAWARELARAGRETVEKRFTIQRVQADFDRLLDQLA